MQDRSWTFRDETFKAMWERVAPYTMTSPERGYALYLAVRHIVENKIQGALVECGVWRGGSAMLMLLTMNEMSAARPVFLFDTFDGMTPPSDHYVDLRGNPAAGLLPRDADAREKSQVWAVAREEEVRANVADCGYDDRLVRFVRGDVADTLPSVQTGAIALLRLDTDFYDSTRAELRSLYPRVSQGGIVIIDDYGHWAGARKAVDDYFALRPRNFRPMLQPIDYTGRLFVKLEPGERSCIERYDYMPPGLENPGMLDHFPSLQASDPIKVPWRYLRHDVPHIWRFDRRAKRPNIGVASVEEAAILHHLAKPFQGRRALEIGCHLAWSSAHLLAAGLDLDIIDPALGDPTRHHDVETTLAALPFPTSYRLWAGYSPAMLEPVRRMRDEPWSFAFVDGNHDAPAPRFDAEGVLPRCAEDAMVVFHDLVSPDVAEGLHFFKEHGWNVRLYNTMQILGVAWRGKVSPVEHRPDPNVPVLLPSHLIGLLSSPA